jgi:DNA-binding transcriptional regulator GbsR (MarR family)
MVYESLMGQEEWDVLRRYIVDACVKSANNRGYCDAVGVLRGTLMLKTEPVSLDQLVEETGYSKSTVSCNMSLLESVGMARRVVVPGEKRYYYIPVTDPDSLRQAMLAHIKSEIQMMMGALDQTERELKDQADNGSAEVLKRVEGIRHFYRQTERLLNLLANYSNDEIIELLERGKLPQ